MFMLMLKSALGNCLDTSQEKEKQKEKKKHIIV